MAKEKVIWLDGELVPWDDANIHVTSYGLYFGIGFFEAIRTFDTPDGPAFFRLDDHLKRLANTAHTYLAKLPYSASDITAACKQTVKANGLTECLVRPIVFLGDGDHPLAAKWRATVIAMSRGPYVTLPDEGGVHTKISSFHRMSANSFPPAAKATGQYLNAYLAQSDALGAKYDDALLLNEHGHVVDGWVHNVFVVRDGVMRTPPVSAGALAGITRDTVITLAREQGLTCVEENLVRTDLYNADEVFLTGTSAGLVPVISVDRRTVGDGKPGEVSRTLADMFGDIVHGRVDLHPEWREPVG